MVQLLKFPIAAIFIYLFIYYNLSYIKYRNVHKQRTTQTTWKIAESANSVRQNSCLGFSVCIKALFTYTMHICREGRLPPKIYNAAFRTEQIEHFCCILSRTVNAEMLYT